MCQVEHLEAPLSGPGEGYCTTAIQSCAGERISQEKPGRKGLGFAAPLESNPAGNAEKLSVSRGKKTSLRLGDSLALYCTFTALCRKCLIMKGEGEGTAFHEVNNHQLVIIIAGVGNAHRTLVNITKAVFTGKLMIQG